MEQSLSCRSLVLFLVLSLELCLAGTPPPDVVEKYLPRHFPLTDELVIKRGYDYRGYRVVTPDGYILTLHRLLHKTKPATKGPVLFMNGFMVTSDNWMMRGKKFDIPFLLLEDGFDVWLGDHRGNMFSRAHVTLSKADAKFWDFSFHEVGYYDIPTFIDFILNKTEFNQTFYIGQSMGSMVYFVFGSTRTDYSHKIRTAALMAPVGGITKPNGPVNGLIINTFVKSYGLLKRLGLYDFLPRSESMVAVVRNSCGTPFMQPICLAMLGGVFGANKANVDKTRISYYMSSIPAGTSIKTAHHLAQCYLAGRFRQYDYGKAENLKRYNSTTPPIYDFTKITSPVALYYGKNDALSSKESVEQMLHDLPNIVRNYVSPDPNFNHIDTIFGNNNLDLFQDIVKLFNEQSKLIIRKSNCPECTKP